MEKDNEKIFIVSLLTRANLRVLSRICKIGESISYMSYRDIGEILGMSYDNVRYHFKALEEDGVIVIEKVNCRKMVFHINMEKAKALVK